MKYTSPGGLVTPGRGPEGLAYSTINNKKRRFFKNIVKVVKNIISQSYITLMNAYKVKQFSARNKGIEFALICNHGLIIFESECTFQ